ncbi:nuclease HARBI1 [Trichonephila clavata]|uniref:Putative nuclease HARBI1 n=1 Tax=Trichonephila clavata TaxID=2740835 RepID=A0A8X6HF47_TRICU|nr:nuclease HARBI1 [Trichonephila clavata]
MDDCFDFFLLEDLETLESIERRSVFIPEHRNNDLDELDEDDFRRRYRFYKGTIETLVELLRTKLDSATGRNHALTAAEKVLAAVRFFAFGNRQINVGDLHSISQPSTSRAITDVARALAELRPQYIDLPQTEDQRMQISQKFYREFGFPGVYGALDCSLIKILNPGGSLAETFRCRKGFFALNVQTVSDPDLSIRNIVVRWPGSTHDSTVFDHSYLRAHVETEVPSSYHLLGDSGYPLRSYLMTPFLNPVGAGQVRYNAAHARARNVIERQYGVWKKRFSCIDTPFRCSLETAQTVIVATAVLHNLALSLGDYEDEYSLPLQQDETMVNHSQEHGGIAKRNAIVANFFN